MPRASRPFRSTLALLRNDSIPSMSLRLSLTGIVSLLRTSRPAVRVQALLCVATNYGNNLPSNYYMLSNFMLSNYYLILIYLLVRSLLPCIPNYKYSGYVSVRVANTHFAWLEGYLHIIGRFFKTKDVGSGESKDSIT